ncbi:MAG: hypothetical protein M0D55_01200 [Elusimicrobiota bacterium]|nr:MAG: hypothetical protein M0D55_01200 [Elusimicrobiota bacterium]
MKPRPADVLVVKFQALGDVLRTTSLLAPLRRRGCRIWWLTKPDARGLLEHSPHLEGLYAADPGDSAAAARMARRLAGRFDLVLSLEEHPAAARIAKSACRGELVGVTLEGGRLSYTPSSAPWYGMSLLAADRAAADERKAANRRSYAELWLGILGLKGGRALPALRLLPRDRAAARRLRARRELRGGGPPIAFNFGAGERWPAKRIGEEKAARLLVAAGRAFGRPLLVLSGKEDEEVRRSRRAVAAAARIDPSLRLLLTPRLPLRPFAALIEGCAALVTTDSLALHVAAALAVPAVALVGPTSAAELDFHGRGRALTPPDGCSCFYAARCARRRPCLDDIAEASVVAALRRCL